MAGNPKVAFCQKKKTMKMGVDTDDTYVVGLEFKGSAGVIIIDIVSRFATRNLILNLEKAQIRWNCDDKVIKIYSVERGKWKDLAEPESFFDSGHDKRVAAKMYLEEIRAFIDAVRGKNPFPNTLEKDIEIIKILETIDRYNSGTGHRKGVEL